MLWKLDQISYIILNRFFYYFFNYVFYEKKNHDLNFKNPILRLVKKDNINMQYNFKYYTFVLSWSTDKEALHTTIQKIYLIFFHSLNFLDIF
jgi:hypothetical protein